MRTPFVNYIKTNKCVDCGYENNRYKKEGYYRK